MKPVSYTHLDVYKRQGLDTAKENTCEKPEKKSGLETALLTVMAGIGPTLYLLGASGMIKGILAVCVMLGLSADTTVYTDVYKRQLPYFQSKSVGVYQSVCRV